MEGEEMYSKKSLNQSSYRYLQQLAKAMCLPCNIKKVHLIELIRAKKFSSENEVKSIIQRVKQERQQLAEVRRNYKANLKSNEIYYKKPQSPPITTTPKRSGVMMGCSPGLHQAVIKYKPRHNGAHGTQVTYSPKIQNGSDRILRSYGLKAINKNMGAFNINNTVVKFIKACNRSCPGKTQIEIVSNESNLPKLIVTAKCFVNNHKPAILGSTADNRNRIHGNGQLQANYKVSSPPLKRQRTVSGIYPLVPQEKYGYLQSIGLRGSDGKTATIQALVQKRSIRTESYGIVNIRKPEINVKDINSCKIDTQTKANSSLMQFVMADSSINNNYVQYPIKTLEKGESNLQVTDQVNIRFHQNMEDIHSVYYHKKIKSEQVRCDRIFNRERLMDERLPKINDAFMQFKDFTQPLYVQVNGLQTTDKRQTSAPRSNTNCGLYERIYNFRSQYLIHQPFLPIAPKAVTKCVFSTPTIVTPKVLPSSATLVHGEPYMALAEPNNGNGQVPSLHTQESISPECECASIPEMVEDALEIISQDGDYMERIGMDKRIQCMLCSWAGPRAMLECHIKKNHSEQISKQSSSEWNITFNLGNLVQSKLCLSQIVEHESTLYILSARYEDPDCFMASICTLDCEPAIQSTGSITTYNTVTREPYLWQGAIQPLQTFESDLFEIYDDCLKVELSNLNLLPNSANLKLESDSPYGVAEGQPELSDIHIMLFIKILD